MILSALARYYDQLFERDEVPCPGWSIRKVSFVLVISEFGELREIVPLDGTETQREVPDQVKRAVNIAANFLCDNSSYFLGIDAKGKPERSLKCFDAARELHCRVLEDVETSAAQAVKRFFETWDPKAAAQNAAIGRAGEDLLRGGNLIFSVRVGGYLLLPTEDPDIRAAWEKSLDAGEDASEMACLVTGERGKIARLHPAIKGVYGAQSSGATLVGFNAPSFCSYGHDGAQGENAPVSMSATRAYAAALNYLLSDPKHHVRMGDTTVVYWSEHHDEGNSDVMSLLLGARRQDGELDAAGRDKLIDDVMKSLAKGAHVDGGVDLSSRFYILGLAPNAARLSVRFFLHDEFGNMLRHVREHYDRLQIAHAKGQPDYYAPYWILHSVENENAKKPVVSSTLSAGLMRSILDGSRYPEALFQNALLRIRATHEVSYERAAILKAYLIRNAGQSKEEVTVELNEERNDTAYVLGRLFALFEEAQNCVSWIEDPNRKLNRTIADAYFDSASTTPEMTFATLFKLNNKHLAKLNHMSDRRGPGSAGRYESLRMELLDKIEDVPARLSLTEQATFMLGYSHQKSAFRSSRKSKSPDVQQEKNQEA